MINQMSQNENTQNYFSDAIKGLLIGKLLRKSNITKSRGRVNPKGTGCRHPGRLCPYGHVVHHGADAGKKLGNGLDAIEMVKQLNQRYHYQGKDYTLPELRKFVLFNNSKNIFARLS